jgi:hypothetical protein
LHEVSLAQYDKGMRLVIFSLAMMALFVNPVRAQDERFWRKMLSGELTREDEVQKVEPKWVFGSPVYHLDLNSDGRQEAIQVFKRDGIDWLDITGHDKSLLFSGKLWAMGVGSSVYRLRLIQLSATTRVLVIHLYEGKTESKKLETSARLYFLTFDNNDFSTFSLSTGPRYWHEYEGIREHYWRRLYSLNVKDYDGDGTKDLAVEYNHIQSIWLYRGRGIWKKF